MKREKVAADRTEQGRSGQVMEHETFEMKVSFSSPVKCGSEMWAQRGGPCWQWVPW